MLDADPTPPSAEERPTAAEEEEVLEAVHRRVVERSLVGAGQVPQAEVERPDRQRDERMHEEAKPHHDGEREQRSQRFISFRVARLRLRRSDRPPVG